MINTRQLKKTFLKLFCAMLSAWFCAGLWGCGPSSSTGSNINNGGDNDGGVTGDDSSVSLNDAYVPLLDGTAEPNWDAFFLEDPPPEYCGPDEGEEPELPGGTPECPDDKNREGCYCHNPGENAPCWPGLRANRNRGICRDGVTECIIDGEFGGRWGPCIGYVLPDPDAVMGPAACRCFSAGRWEIDNLSPCFITYNGNQIYAVSTWVNGGAAQCPSNISENPPPSPEPGTDWSTNRLTVDCAGEFELCYTLRAGDENNPQPTDCELVTVCVDFWYDTADETVELPPLPAWTSSNTSCASEFVNSGGYGEMSVLGLSIECDPVDDGSGDFYIFHRIGYCPLECNNNPNLPECQNCGSGGSGGF